MSQPVVDIENLKTYFHTEQGIVPAVDGVSFSINRGEVMALVGESGSGKSVTALSIMRLIKKPGEIKDGVIILDGENILEYPLNEMRKIRGNDLSIVFQEPLTSLNPTLTIGKQMMESIILHLKIDKKEAKSKCIELLQQVGITRAESIFKSYPHHLSGGMRQRVLIAIAISCDPKLLIADEPTTALDVTIQAQILQLMEKLTND